MIASSVTKAGRSCGTMIMMSFLENPAGAPDTSCLADVVPVSFDGDAATTKALFGTDDAWSEAPRPSRPSCPSPPSGEAAQ